MGDNTRQNMSLRMEDPKCRLLKTISGIPEKGEAFVKKKGEEFESLVDEHLTWLNEILIEVKKSFASAEIQILPKTPSAKRARKKRKATYREGTDSADGGDDEEDEAPPPKSRNTRSRRAGDVLSESGDSAASAPETKRSTRSTRGSRSASSRSSRSTRSSRNQAQKKLDVSEDLAVPITNIMKMAETIEEVFEPPATPIKTVFSILSQGSTASPKTPKTASLIQDVENTSRATPKTPKPVLNCENGKNTPTDAFTGLRLTPRSASKPALKSPQCIPGFAALNVKEQAKAYEKMVGSSDEATPKMDRVGLQQQSQTPRVDCSDSEYGTPSSGSPLTIADLKSPEEGSRTPVTVHVPQTPPTVLYTSKATLTLSNEKAAKCKSRILQQVLSAEKMPAKRKSSMQKSSDRTSCVRKSMSRNSLAQQTSRGRRSSVRKSKSQRLSIRAGLKKSKMSLSRRKSSVLHYQAPRISAATCLEVSQSPQSQDDEIITVSPIINRCTKPSTSAAAVPNSPKQPGSKLRLKKSNRDTPTKSPDPPPQRTTRTKTRQMASCSSVSSDENVFSRTAPAELPGRSTRTKSRQQATSSTSTNSDSAVSSPLRENRRVTRSKVRHTKSTTELPEYENNAQECRTTRTKSRKREHADSSSDGAAGEPATEGNKRRKSEKTDVSVVLVDDSSDEEHAHEQVAGKNRLHQSVCHTPAHPSSFLNAMKNNTGSGNRMHGTLNGLVSSFIKRNTPKKKSALEKREEQKKEFLKKKQQQEDRMQRIREQRKKEVELARKKREEHMKKVLAKKQQREKELKENTKRTVEKAQEKLAITIQIREQKEKAEREKLQKMREKKLLEIEERKKQEEAVRLQKLKEKEEEERRHQQMLQRKREFEEKERAVKLQEEKRQADAKKRELEQQKLKEQEILRKEQEEQERQRRKEQEEKEKQLAKERAERAQQELERKKEKEKKEKEEREKERIRLQQQLAEEKSRQEDEERRRKEQEKLKNAIKQSNQALPHSSLNTSINNSIYSSSKLNSTFEKDKNVSSDSYPITPQGKNRCDNYDIEDMHSDDSTDDEDKPRKQLPTWAIGASLKANLLNQYYRPPDVDEMFGVPEMPDLTIMFSKYKQRTRFKKRTSSAVWDSPLYKSPK